MIEVLAVATLALTAFSAYNYGIHVERRRVKPVAPRRPIGFKGGEHG